MTKTALAILLVLVLLVLARLWAFWDDRQPPSGVETQQATVLGFEELGRSRPRDRSPEFTSIHFQLPDGREGSALYQLRTFGEAEKGDTITVFERDGEWRTTTERAWGSIVMWIGGLVLLLVMIFGWFRVRSRAGT